MSQQPVIGQGNEVKDTQEFERREGRRIVLYLAIAIVVILVIGFLAAVLDKAIRNTTDNNVFLENSREILAVIGSTAPWIVFFIILCSSWIFISDRLFVRWNRGLGEPDNQNRGMIYEIVHDNNSAAALILLLPMLLIAMGLIYVALLNLPFNIPTVVTPATPRP